MQNQAEPPRFFVVRRTWFWLVQVVRRESVICDLSTPQRSPKRNAAETATPRDFAHRARAHAPQNNCTNALHQAATENGAA